MPCRPPRVVTAAAGGMVRRHCRPCPSRGRVVRVPAAVDGACWGEGERPVSDKPSYLGLLNAIAVAETRAHCYLTAWAEVTTDPDVRAVLRKVALREGEHGISFTKRINELGYEVREKEDPNFAQQLELARSNKTDLEKLEAFGLDRLDTGNDPDIFDGIFKDHTIDIQTGELLGRYIAEERDTGRLVRGCHGILKDRCEMGTAATPASDDRLVALDGKVDALCRAVEDLRQIVCAQAMPVNAS